MGRHNSDFESWLFDLYIDVDLKNPQRGPTPVGQIRNAFDTKYIAVAFAYGALAPTAPSARWASRRRLGSRREWDSKVKVKAKVKVK